MPLCTSTNGLTGGVGAALWHGAGGRFRARGSALVPVLPAQRCPQRQPLGGMRRLQREVVKSLGPHTPKKKTQTEEEMTFSGGCVRLCSLLPGGG